tara:strand:+ start:8536 stop:8724 length:189 start_codon:yes stop_codon:yes gene_type:complete
MENTITYTPEELMVFTQLYTSNFAASCITTYEINNNIVFSYKDFAGKNFAEKLDAFNKTIKK